MQYRIVNTPTILLLEERVAHYMNEGWVVQGGVCVVTEDGLKRYYQAMIKT
jgi:hypothetical protein